MLGKSAHRSFCGSPGSLPDRFHLGCVHEQINSASPVGGRGAHPPPSRSQTPAGCLSYSPTRVRHHPPSDGTKSDPKRPLPPPLLPSLHLRVTNPGCPPVLLTNRLWDRGSSSLLQLRMKITSYAVTRAPGRWATDPRFPQPLLGFHLFARAAPRAQGNRLLTRSPVYRRRTEVRNSQKESQRRGRTPSFPALSGRTAPSTPPNVHHP